MVNKLSDNRVKLTRRELPISLAAFGIALMSVSAGGCQRQKAEERAEFNIEGKIRDL